MPAIKKCKTCKAPANIKIQMNHFCDFNCAIVHAKKIQDKAKAEKAKRERQIHRERKEAVKTRSEWLRQAQTVFNQYIRLRDEKNPCISCGRPNDGTHQRHASHYKSRGASPELAFNELNCHASCSQCNNFLSGNLVPYRVALIDKIGLDKVEWLEGPHQPTKLTIGQIKDLIAEYKAKVKALKVADC